MRCDLHQSMRWPGLVKRQGWTLYILLYVNYARGGGGMMMGKKIHSTPSLPEGQKVQDTSRGCFQTLLIWSFIYYVCVRVCIHIYLYICIYIYLIYRILLCVNYLFFIKYKQRTLFLKLSLKLYYIYTYMYNKV